MTKDTIPQDFTLGLALFDALPVILFGMGTWILWKMTGSGIVLEALEGSDAHDLDFGFPDMQISRPLSAENVFFLEAEDDFIRERICISAPLRVRFIGVLVRIEIGQRPPFRIVEV